MLVAGMLGLLAVMVAGCATGVDAPPERLFLTTVVAPDAGTPVFSGEACSLLGDRTPCPCPDGTTEGVKVCTGNADSPSKAAYSTCIACPGTPIAAHAAGSSASVPLGMAGAAGASRAAVPAGTGGSAGVTGQAGTQALAGSAGYAGAASSVAGALAIDAGVPVAGTGGAGQAGSAGKAAAGSGGSTSMGGAAGTSAGACTCQRFCLIGSQPCCRLDGLCGCTLPLGNICL